MSIKISSSTINKLEHEILEIRTRTFKHIEGKINRALLQNQSIIFNPAALIKQLIRWFGLKPLCEEEEVLILIITILRSKYIHEAIKPLGLERFKREIGKVYEVVTSSQCKKLVCDIKDILENYEVQDEEEFVTISSKSSSNGKGSEGSSTIDLCSLSDVINDEFSPDYEKPWSTPSVPDYNSLKLLCHSLSASSTDMELEHAFKYLKSAINDYPAEYFLQPPYIFKGLLMLYLKDKRMPQLLMQNLINLTKAIKGRVNMRKLPQTFSPENQENKLLKSKTQLTISRFCMELFNLCHEKLKDLNENHDQEQIYFTFSLLFEIINLIECDPNCYIPSPSLLIDLGYIAKYYRQSLEIDQKPSRIDRFQYMLIIFLMAKLVNLGKFRDNNDNEYQTGTKRSSKIYDPKLYLSESVDESRNSQLFRQSDIWHTELENALLDLPLKCVYPEEYDSIQKAVKVHKIKEDSVLRILLDCDKQIAPAVKLMSQPESFSDEDFIFHGFESLQTLSIHRSLELVKKLIQVISRSIPLFDGNVGLKTTAETIILRLLSHDSLRIKRLAYKECANSMKYFFGCLMEGEATLDKLYSTELSRAKTLGIPLTSDILTEIICFGYNHSDPTIKSTADTMLCLIIRGKSVLGKHWENILEILLPNMPLLQCLTSKFSNLGVTILELLNPDDDFPLIDMIQGNLRLLFSEDAAVRSEALSRIVYILSSHAEASDYVPNVLQISDTLPNDICLVAAARDPEKIFAGGFYDRSTINGLLELLRSSDVEPSIRKTSFLQLNVVCQDSELLELIYDENGWFLALQALDNSLKRDPVNDYPETVIPAIGILSKMALCNPQFRRELSTEGNIYFLLVRALFLFHSDIVIQQDCSVLLFLLLYSPYIIGSKQISIPKFFEKLKIPIKCNFHWNESPFEKKSLLEELYLKLSNNEQNNSLLITPRSAQPTPLSPIIDITSYRSADSEISENTNHTVIKKKAINEEDIAISPELGLQFIRMTFAYCWFDGFDGILKYLRNNKNSEDEWNYTVIPLQKSRENDENVVEISHSFSFNRNLHLKKIDMQIMRYSSVNDNVNVILRKISNATNYHATKAYIAEIKICLLLSTNCQLEGKHFLNIFRRFIIMLPTNEMEILIFEDIINLLGKLIDSNDEDIFQWMLEDIQDRNNIFYLLLKNYDCPLSLYQNVCDFLKTLIKKCIYGRYDNKLQEFIISSTKRSSDKSKKKEECNLYNSIFEFLIPVVEECFHKRLWYHVRSLLSLLEIISSSKLVDIDSGYIYIVAKKLFYFITTLKSFTQAGSHVHKNCLLIIGYLMMDIDEFVLDVSHIRLLSGLCGHSDFQVRALSWTILAKMCKCLQGAHLIVKELSFLPGGFHACCLSTFLDVHEVGMVRTAAGGVFANLLSHSLDDSGEGLHMAVAPLCIELEPSTINNGFELVMRVFSKHLFFKAIVEYLDHFYIMDEAIDIKAKEITTCEIVKTHCSILINFIDLKPSVIDELAERQGIIRTFDLIKKVPSCITTSSLEMAGEICSLLARFLQPKSKFLQKSISQDREFIIALLSLLDIKFYDNQAVNPLISMLQLLRIFGNNSVSYQIISEIIGLQNNVKLLELLSCGLNPGVDCELQEACLKLLTTLLIKGQRESFKYASVPQILDSVQIFQDNAKESHTTIKTYRSTADNFNDEKGFDSTRRILDKVGADYTYGSQILFWNVKRLFESEFYCRKSKNFESVSSKKVLMCETLAALLNSTEKSRTIANDLKFLNDLISRFETIFKCMGMTCTDFIRKHGDSKKNPIIQEFILLYGILLNWYSVECLSNENQISELCQVILKSWPWVSHSNELRTIFMKFLAFLSEDSMLVCKQFSTTTSTFSFSILQQVTSLVHSETNKVKHPSIDFTVLELGLRVIANCCCCIEGRMQVIKVNLLDIFNKFHPSITKLQRSWNIITIMWLKFWEIFSRHPEGATVKNLILICTLIAKANDEIRLLCLKVLRNMAFLNTNRSALLSSQDFMYTVNNILANGTYDEQLLVSLMIWKFIADSHKSKHAIKNTSIPKKLNNILRKDSFENIKTDENDLVSVIEIILKILNE